MNSLSYVRSVVLETAKRIATPCFAGARHKGVELRSTLRLRLGQGSRWRLSPHRAPCLGRMGGTAGGTSIKVGNMVPACCECKPGGSIADTSFQETPYLADFKAVLAAMAGPRFGRSAAVRNSS